MMKEVLAITLAPIGGKKERETFSILRRNASSVSAIVKKLENLITAFFEGDIKKAESIGREIAALESEADNGRRNFMKIIHGGAFLPTFRGDLTLLAEKLDEVADTAEDVMRAMLLREKLIKVLQAVEKKSAKIKDFRASFLKMAGLTTEVVDTLKRSVDALETNIDIALKNAQLVDKMEHELDLIEQGLLNDLYEYEKYFDPVSIVQLADIIRRLGDVSDMAEDTSDSVEIVAHAFRA